MSTTMVGREPSRGGTLREERSVADKVYVRGTFLSKRRAFSEHLSSETRRKGPEANLLNPDLVTRT